MSGLRPDPQAVHDQPAAVLTAAVIDSAKINSWVQVPVNPASSSVGRRATSSFRP